MDSDAPAALILHFCQQNSEALPEAAVVLPARKPKGSRSTVSAVTHGPSMAPGLAELPAHGHCAPKLLQVYSGTLERGRHHSLLVALSSQEDQGGCQGSLCQFCWHRDQRKPKRKSEQSTRQELSEAPDLLDLQVPVTLSLTPAEPNTKVTASTCKNQFSKA